MTNKLKCWKQGRNNKNRFFNEKRKEIIEINKFDKSNDYFITSDRPSLGRGIGFAKSKTRAAGDYNTIGDSPGNWTIFSALKKAKSYMRRHDKC